MSGFTPYYMNSNIRIVAGAVVTAATTADETTDAIPLFGNYQTAVFTLKISALALANASDEADFHFQTSYDGGQTWEALANVHWANADDGTTPNRFVFIARPSITTVTDITPSTTASDDGVVTTMPLGGMVRIFLDLTITGTPSVTYTCALEAKG